MEGFGLISVLRFERLSILVSSFVSWTSLVWGIRVNDFLESYFCNLSIVNVA